MPASPRETVLCRYRYDPLDSLVDCAPVKQAGIQRFYCKSRLATEIQGAVQRSVFQHDDQLLAQRRREDAKVDTTLLATDQQRSVLNVLDATGPNPLAYTPYGHRPTENGLLSLLGFNGERPDPVTGHYLLGNGYRAFNPVLMRFNSPDSLSPFGEGGLNAYGYCGGDSINRSDPTGHLLGVRRLLRNLGIISPKIDVYAVARSVEEGTELTIKGKAINSVVQTAFSQKPIPLDKVSKEKLRGITMELEHINDHKFNSLIRYRNFSNSTFEAITNLHYKTKDVLSTPPKTRNIALNNLYKTIEKREIFTQALEAAITGSQNKHKLFERRLQQLTNPKLTRNIRSQH